ncbi:transmembrane protein, putative (macronuclear) [Tetrahymena thermophila SB210]|uniref:Transmembrane protein, putative n=1 Tax=Tetrahymena thermophila (strain SB210) TaxID=312017 RepID=Q23Q83_TETTS|nr:transmembrane protein, putative [Tetrahymena thermophila SB210]EAR98701.1 transmembrane protein, putative [Tetrahymena thermophila SB210]|eukprot:XP_001018946.1 transmembrane protein, putative [Tetrahymena thermophila SB210]
MKIQQTIILISILALLGLTTVITLQKSSQNSLQDYYVPCLEKVINGDKIYAKNICSESKYFTVVIYSTYGFSRGYTPCLSQNEMELVALTDQTWSIPQQFDC